MNSGLNLDRWNGECKFAMSSPVGTTRTYPLDKDSHLLEMGGHELEIILDSPLSEVPFYIESEGLDFFYQAEELTDIEKSLGAVRPEPVKGSFAAYHKTKKDYKYKTGKFGHLLRPTATDANGVWIFGKWIGNPLDGLLVASFNPEWMDSAVYPVIIGPTVGYTSIGGTTFDGSPYIYGTHFTAGASFTASTFHLYTNSASIQFTLGVYNSNGTTPSTLVAATAGGALGGAGSPEWKTRTISAALTSGNHYLLAITYASTTNTYYDTTSSSWSFAGRTYVDGTLPGTFPTTTDLSNVIFSAYVDDGGGALTSGTASFGSATATTINVSVGAASGGTSPYTYQWYRSTTANFTPGGGNLLSGATSTSLADTASLSFGTYYYYKCIATDNVSATVTSNQVAGTLFTSALSVYMLGDSITYSVDGGPNPPADTLPQLVAIELKKIYRQRSTTVTNGGIDGAKAQDYATDAGGILTAAVSAAQSASASHVWIMLGVNDAAAHRTAAQFKSDLQTIGAAFLAVGIKVMVNYPTYIPAGANSGATDEAATESIRTYLAKIDELVDGTNYLQGDKLAYGYIMDHPTEVQTDQTHLLEAGEQSLAVMQSRAFDRAVLNPASGSGIMFNPSLDGMN